MGRGDAWTFFLEMHLFAALKAFSFCFRFEAFYGVGVPFLIEVIVLEFLPSILLGNCFLPVEVFRVFFSSLFGYPFLRRDWGCILKLVI